MQPFLQRLVRLLFVHQLHIRLTAAESVWSGGPCVSSCQLWLSQVTFTDIAVDAQFITGWCDSRLSATSLYLCAELYCPHEDTVEGLVKLNNTCRAVNSPLPPVDVIAEYIENGYERVRRVEVHDSGFGFVFDEPILPSEAYFDSASSTLYATEYVHWYHNFFESMISWFWAAVILIGILRHWLQTLRSPRSVAGTRQSLDAETLLLKSKPRALGYPSLYLRRFITVPATFGYRCLQNVGWCTIPPRIETLVIVLFALMNIAFCVHGYVYISNNLYFSTVSKQAWRYASDRTGILAWASFPVIWLFGMRNNLLMGLTGWDFGTFNNFHRWVARIATLQAVVHSIGYTTIVFRGGGWRLFSFYWGWVFWWTGELATVAMCTLMATSLFWVRRNMYEVFLVTHIVLSILVLIPMLFHVSLFNGLYDWPFWVCLFIWLADRVLRVARVLAFNPWFWNTRAQLTYSPSSNMIRLVVPYTNSIYKPQPGTYYYIYVLSDTRIWESHPFTMAYASPGHDPETVSLLHSDRSPVPSSEAVPPSMTFLIRPYDSFTSRLKNLAAHKTNNPRVLIEGPYGASQPLDRFDDVLFIVGGSGIVVPLSYLDQLNRSPNVRSVRIAWCIREPDFAEEVLHNDISDKFESGKITMDVFLTLESPERRHLSPTGWPKQVSVIPGRPDVAAEIVSASKNAAGGSVAIVTCGPAKMADDSRRTVVEMLALGYHRVEYFQEAFNW